MPEFESHAIAAGEYHWIRLSNMSLHHWSWESIVLVLCPLGDLIYVQKREEASLQYLKVLALLKNAISFPMEIIIDIGVRSFNVLLEDSGIPILLSKVVQASTDSSKSNLIAPAQRTSSSNTVVTEQTPQTSCSTHQIPSEHKSKSQALVMPSIEISGKSVECGSGLEPLMEFEDVPIVIPRPVLPLPPLQL